MCEGDKPCASNTRMRPSLPGSHRQRRCLGLDIGGPRHHDRTLSTKSCGGEGGGAPANGEVSPSSGASVARRAPRQDTPRSATSAWTACRKHSGSRYRTHVVRWAGCASAGHRLHDSSAPTDRGTPPRIAGQGNSRRGNSRRRSSELASTSSRSSARCASTKERRRRGVRRRGGSPRTMEPPPASTLARSSAAVTGAPRPPYRGASRLASGRRRPHPARGRAHTRHPPLMTLPKRHSVQPLAAESLTGAELGPMTLWRFVGSVMGGVSTRSIAACRSSGG